jgi:hypothetical protein
MLLALIAFFVLLGSGIAMGELTWLQAGLWSIFAVVAGVVMAVLQWSAILFYVLLAVLDVVLILVIFHGDIKIN